MTNKEMQEIKKQIEEMSISELKDLAYKMLVTRYKSNLRKKKYYAKKEGGKNESN